jgi:hypothetical protein
MVLRFQRAGIGLALLIASGCVSYPPRPYPWNFPPEEEWNQPFETSWQNAVDTYRRLTAPKGKTWDPLMQSYQSYLGRDKDGERQ